MSRSRTLPALATLALVGAGALLFATSSESSELSSPAQAPAKSARQKAAPPPGRHAPNKGELSPHVADPANLTQVAGRRENAFFTAEGEVLLPALETAEDASFAHITDPTMMAWLWGPETEAQREAELACEVEHLRGWSGHCEVAFAFAGRRSGAGRATIEAASYDILLGEEGPCHRYATCSAQSWIGMHGPLQHLDDALLSLSVQRKHIAFDGPKDERAEVIAEMLAMMERELASADEHTDPLRLIYLRAIVEDLRRRLAAATP